MTNRANNITRVVHGALDYGELARLDLSPSEILDFSVNSNPFGPSPHVRAAIANVAIERYPDRECLQLRQAILDYKLAEAGVSLSSLVCGNGTSELIWAIARTFLKPGEKTLIVGPTFGEYLAACQAVGAAVVEHRVQETAYFQPSIANLSDCIEVEQPRLIWLCNPNNPTGSWLDRHEVVQLVEACRSIDAWLVVDESYWHFVFPHESSSAIDLISARGDARILVLRSLTKDFALAAVRLGYAIGSPPAIERLSAQLPSWNVSGVAQAAGVAALSDRSYLAATLAALAEERQAFFHALRQVGLYVVPSRTHFCLVEVGNAQFVRQQLLMRRLLVRDCASFGLPTFIRVSTRKTSEWQQLVQALQEVL